MRFVVRHRTLYRYSAPVRLGDHVVRLTPRDDGGVLLSRDLVVVPEPVLRTDAIDRNGNRVTTLAFAGETDVLSIDSRFEFETALPPPAEADLAALPWRSAETPASTEHLGTGEHESVRAFAREIAEASDRSPLPFLDRLNRTLHARTRHHIRGGGFAQTAETTLATGAGACRDTAVLFIAAARAMGMPARFVSGYQARAETADGGRHLHAWPEVHLPGIGWRGYDPTHGLAVEDGHVALAAAPDQMGTMPLEGGFWGDGVTSKLDYVVRIEAEG